MFKFDEDLVSVDQGVWTEWNGSKFKIAHISNMKFQRALARLQQPYRRRIETGSIDPNTNKKIVAQAMAETILIDWDKVVNTENQDTPYTPVVGQTALMKSSEFRDFVSDFAMNLSNFREEEIEALGKD